MELFNTLKSTFMLDQAGAIKAKYKTSLSQKIVRIDFKIGLSAVFFFFFFFRFFTHMLTWKYFF